MASHAMLNLIAENRRECRRREPRQRVLLSAKLITTTSEWPVTVRDLTSIGARVEGHRIPPAGTDLILKRGPLEAFARIIWSTGNAGGVEFEEPLTEDEMLAEAHPGATTASAVVYKRPGFRSRPLSEDERAWAAAWANPVGRDAFGE